MEDIDVREQVFFLNSSSKKPFGVRSYMPENEQVKAIVQIIPGMAEHAARYSQFANFLATNGYGVFIADHPGSGITAGDIHKLGIVPANKGWEMMLENIRSLYTYIRKEIPEVPLYLLGHSMGSILARHFTAVYPVYIQGLIMSGSFELPASLLKGLRIFIAVMIRIEGSKSRNNWFNKLFYSVMNKRYRNGPTHFEWISSVRNEVDAYVDDPYCGYDCSWGFFKTLFRGTTAMKRAQNNLKYRKTLPLLNICGQDDPVGHFGRDAMKIHRDYYRKRFQNNTVKVFKGRHELIHEDNRDQVFLFLLNWMNDNLRP